MNTNWKASLDAVLKHEGKWVNDPADPGGETNLGVTKRVYLAWCKLGKIPPKSMRALTPQDVEPIYKAQYWDAVQGDLLTKGVDYVMFDTAVLSGPVQAVKWLQQAIGVKADGHVGAVTLAAVKAAVPLLTITRIMQYRLGLYQRLKGWVRFGKGWTRRLNEVKATALEMER